MKKDEIARVYDDALADVKGLTDFWNRGEVLFLDEFERWKLEEGDYERLAWPVVFFQMNMSSGETFAEGFNREYTRAYKISFVLSFESDSAWEIRNRVDELAAILSNWERTNLYFFTRKLHRAKKIREVETGNVIQEVHKNKTYYKRQIFFNYYIQIN